MHTALEQYEYLVSKGMSHRKATNWAFVNVRQGVDCIPCALIEYARPFTPMPDLTAYYQECRSKARSPNYTFVGD
jgi:hypothetical protein